MSEYGQHLIIQREYALAKKQYNKILGIERNIKSARQKIVEIEAYENQVIKNELSSNQDGSGS